MLQFRLAYTDTTNFTSQRVPLVEAEPDHYLPVNSHSTLVVERGSPSTPLNPYFSINLIHVFENMTVLSYFVVFIKLYNTF